MWNWIEVAHSLNQNSTPFALVTVTEAKGSTPRDPGAKMIVTVDKVHGTIGGGKLEYMAIAEAREALQGQRGESADISSWPLCFKTGQCCGGSVNLLTELHNMGPRVVIFGAGHVAQALCKVLDDTGVALAVVDDREEWINHNRIPARVERVATDPSRFLQKYTSSKRDTWFLVMTHDHGLDLELTRELLTRPARFIGVIGSETKAKRFRQQLERGGLDTDLINRMNCPIGEKSRGKAPAEIAIHIGSYLLRLMDADKQ